MSFTSVQFSSVTQSCLPSLSLSRPPSPSPSFEVCPSSCPLHQLCHIAISSFDALFSFCSHSFPASGSFPMRKFFAWGGQSTGVSALVSFLPKKSQGWFPLGLTDLICCPRDSQESSPSPQFESINSSALSALYGSILTSVHDYWKNHLPRWLSGKESACNAGNPVSIPG